MARRERGKGIQIDVKVAGMPRHREMFYGTDKEAAIRENLIKACMAAGQSVPALGDGEAHDKAIGLSLGELRKRTCERYWKGKKAEEALDRNAGLVCEFFGEDTPAAAINEAQIDRLIEARKKAGDANGTINRKLAAVSRMLRYAASRGWITRAPKIERLKEFVGRIRYLTADEEQASLKFLRQCNAVDMDDLFCTGIDTGMRVSEILDLTKRDCLPSTGLITIWENKASHPRSIPMTTRVRKIIERRAAGLGSNDRVFAVDYRLVRSWWGRLRVNLELTEDEQFVFHALRHTFASRLVQRGVPILTVKELLGHKTLTMTMRYAHLAPNNLSSAISLLEGPPGGAPIKDILVRDTVTQNVTQGVARDTATSKKPAQDAGSSLHN